MRLGLRPETQLETPAFMQALVAPKNITKVAASSAGVIFLASMKNLFPLLLLILSTSATADWLRITVKAGLSHEKFIDVAAIRQTGPMNTMRRVWEISNLAKGAHNKVLSIKAQVEYDCKDRRFRVLEESSFSEPWAQGETLAVVAYDGSTAAWRDIAKSSVDESIFNRVCPNDDPDTRVD